jgi:hypothetical protein
MIGLRGASRYYHDLYIKDGFRLECSFTKVRMDHQCKSDDTFAEPLRGE